MASTVKHLRSSTASKRPTASGLAEGQLAINTASGTPGLFLKDSAGTVVKVGPVHVGAGAPNAVPAGSAGNSAGELWVDNSATIHGLNYYTGSAFVNLTPSGTATVAGLVELATDAETQTGTDTIRAVTPSGLQSKVSNSTSTTSSTTIASSTAVKAAYDLADAALPKAGGRVTGNLEIGPVGSLSFEGSSDDSFETTLAVVNPTADRTITLPNVTGTVITTGDSGTVTSTMIADGTIVDADINASAAIALSKLATGALPTAITVASANIVDGTIVNADINASAAIVDTKLATISTAGKVSGAAITSGNISTSGDLFITNASPAVALGESDGTATHSQTLLVRDTNIFQIQTRNSTGTYLSNDYNITSDASGASLHQWLIANTERARIDSSGNVGIGTSSPGTALDTNGTIRSSTGVVQVNNATQFKNYEFLHSGTRTGIVSFDNTNNWIYTNAEAAGSQLLFGTASTERARIDSSGNVGIGTSSPSVALDVYGSGNRQIRAITTDTSGTNVGQLLATYTGGGGGANSTISLVAGDGYAIVGTQTNTPLLIKTNDIERARITSAGALQIAEAGDIQVGTTTGTKIGTATTQKIGFYDATPVVQPTAVADATDAATVITQLNALLTRMRNLGLIAT
jgi:hypothetical protein